MLSDIPKYPAIRLGDISREVWPEFFTDVANGLRDAQLAVKYQIHERTACNWRRRAEQLIKEKGATPDKDAPNSTPPATNGVETSSSNCDTGDTGFATPEQIGA